MSSSDHENSPSEDDLYIPLSFSLPPAGSITACGKCGIELLASSRVYHKCGYVGAPCEEIFGYPAVAELGEHLCRQCLVCGHVWVESVIGKRE